jgi:hypothetical protein
MTDPNTALIKEFDRLNAIARTDRNMTIAVPADVWRWVNRCAQQAIHDMPKLKAKNAELRAEIGRLKRTTSRS